MSVQPPQPRPARIGGFSIPNPAAKPRMKRPGSSARSSNPRSQANGNSNAKASTSSASSSSIGVNHVSIAPPRSISPTKPNAAAAGVSSSTAGNGTMGQKTVTNGKGKSKAIVQDEDDDDILLPRLGTYHSGADPNWQTLPIFPHPPMTSQASRAGKGSLTLRGHPAFTEEYKREMESWNHPDDDAGTQEGVVVARKRPPPDYPMMQISFTPEIMQELADALVRGDVEIDDDDDDDEEKEGDEKNEDAEEREEGEMDDDDDEGGSFNEGKRKRLGSKKEVGVGRLNGFQFDIGHPEQYRIHLPGTSVDPNEKKSFDDDSLPSNVHIVDSSAEQHKHGIYFRPPPPPQLIMEGDEEEEELQDMDEDGLYRVGNVVEKLSVRRKEGVDLGDAGAKLRQRTKTLQEQKEGRSTVYLDAPIGKNGKGQSRMMKKLPTRPTNPVVANLKAGFASSTSPKVSNTPVNGPRHSAPPITTLENGQPPSSATRTPSTSISPPKRRASNIFRSATPNGIKRKTQPNSQTPTTSQHRQPPSSGPSQPQPGPNPQPQSQTASVLPARPSPRPQPPATGGSRPVPTNVGKGLPPKPRPGSRPSVANIGSGLGPGLVPTPPASTASSPSVTARDSSRSPAGAVDGSQAANDQKAAPNHNNTAATQKDGQYRKTNGPFSKLHQFMPPSPAKTATSPSNGSQTSSNNSPVHQLEPSCSSALQALESSAPNLGSTASAPPPPSSSTQPSRKAGGATILKSKATVKKEEQEKARKQREAKKAETSKVVTEPSSVGKNGSTPDARTANTSAPASGPQRPSTFSAPGNLSAPVSQPTNPTRLKLKPKNRDQGTKLPAPAEAAPTKIESKKRPLPDDGHEPASGSQPTKKPKLSESLPTASQVAPSSNKLEQAVAPPAPEFLSSGKPIASSKQASTSAAKPQYTGTKAFPANTAKRQPKVPKIPPSDSEESDPVVPATRSSPVKDDESEGAYLVSVNKYMKTRTPEQGDYIDGIHHLMPLMNEQMSPRRPSDQEIAASAAKAASKGKGKGRVTESTKSPPTSVSARVPSTTELEQDDEPASVTNKRLKSTPEAGSQSTASRKRRPIPVKSTGKRKRVEAEEDQEDFASGSEYEDSESDDSDHAARPKSGNSKRRKASTPASKHSKTKSTGGAGGAPKLISAGPGGILPADKLKNTAYLPPLPHHPGSKTASSISIGDENDFNRYTAQFNNTKDRYATLHAKVNGLRTRFLAWKEQERKRKNGEQSKPLNLGGAKVEDIERDVNRLNRMKREMEAIKGALEIYVRKEKERFHASVQRSK